MLFLADNGRLILLWAGSAAAALALSGSMFGQEVWKRMGERWYVFLIIGVLFGLPGCRFWATLPFLGTLAQLLMIPAAALCFRFSAGLTWPCAAAAGALAGTLWVLSLSAGLLLEPMGVVCLLPAAAAAGSAGFVFWRRLSLLPENYGQFLGDGRKFSGLSWYLWVVAGLFFLLDGWMAFLLVQENTFLVWQKIALWCFLTVLLAVLLPLIRGCAFHFVDQVEGLIDQKYRAELLGFMQVIRSQRHDFNFHLQTLSGLIGREAYGECQAYLETMVKNAGKMNDLLQLRRPELGAMLGTFQEIALQKDIEFQIAVQNQMEQVPCTVYELNTVIGNLIQNAIDEVEEHHKDSPWIHVLLMKRGGNNVVRVTNPYHGAPEKLQRVLEPGYSTKNAHEGIGLTTVQRILSRYGGVVFPEFRDGTVSFIAQFPLVYGGKG